MSLLTVDGLNFGYSNDVRVLHDVCLSVESGQVTGLIGPNGSGKSTLIKVVLDLLDAGSGRITIDGHPHASTHAKMAAIYLASNDYLPPFLTGREYLKLLARMYSAPYDDSRADQYFTDFGMHGRLGDLIEDYSHGMRKKTQLIAAFLQRRPLTIVDETLNGIDFESLAVVEQEFRAMRSEGLGILLCTHDFALLERLADRIAFLDLGHVMVDAPLSTCLDDHTSLAAMVSHHLGGDRAA